MCILKYRHGEKIIVEISVHEGLLGTTHTTSYILYGNVQIMVWSYGVNLLPPCLKS